MTTSTEQPGFPAKILTLPARDEVLASAEAMERDLPSLKRYYAARAQMIHSYFESLVDAGFDDEDAIFLCSEEFDNR